MADVLLQTDLAGLRLAGRGKVRDIYDLGDRLLIIATDRISAFDCILPTGIPDKGRVLTGLSRFWFAQMQDLVPNHLDQVPQEAPAGLQQQWPQLRPRSMICRKAAPYPVECVARGFLSGSAWKEYQANLRAGAVTNGRVSCCGTTLPEGLVESEELPEPIFTPATKAASGHDENISFDQMAAQIGGALAEELRAKTLAIYARARAYARAKGILIADTKFEFGVVEEGLLLIDEALTPDSSRFWDAAAYQPGKPQPSFDKQFVRDYLETLDWDKTPPAPPLPPEIVERTAAKYREAYQRLTGHSGFADGVDS